MQGLVTAHPKAKGVPHEDLFDSFAVSEFFDHLHGIGNGTIQRGVSRIHDFPRRINRFIELGGTINPRMTYISKKAKGIHFLQLQQYFSRVTRTLAKDGARFIRKEHPR